VLHAVLPLPVPASVYGLVLLLAALTTGFVKLEQVKETGTYLTGIFPLLFVPAAAGIMELWAEMGQLLLPILIAILPVLLCCLFIPHTVLSIYTDDLVLADASIPSLLVICCASIAMSFGIPLFEAVSGTGNTTNALILESVVLIAYTFSVWFFASYISTRVEWVWTSEFTYGTLIGLVSWLFMRFASWQRKKI